MNFLHQNHRERGSLKSRDVFSQKTRVAKFLKKMPVRLLILHGSVAQGQSRALSDIDFAVLFKNDSYKLKDVTKIQSFLSETFKRDDIDLVILNHASPLLCMQVLSKGQIIYEDNSESSFYFREQTILRYLRTKYLRTQFHRYQKQAVFGERF